MSVQFGTWNFEGQPPASDYIEKVSETLAPHGPDSNEAYSKDGIRILYRALHTTKESRRETQPHISRSGAVITWDGRLDNRADLIIELRDSLTVSSTDVAIVAAAYEKWGAKCLGKLIGDWALSIWNPIERSLILAKDPIGIRHLYYSSDDRQITWSTILDPLVLFADKTFALNEEYIAGWFSHFPAAYLTPYLGIHTVPPSSYVLCQSLGDNVKHNVSKYWDFDPRKRIRYRTDAEYEEHFRIALATAVQRRLRSDRPILAELSGGMDSSSIVCMADTLIARGAAECPRLDTISWFDDSYDHLEPDTNERRYFSKVEEKRGRTGCHVDLASLKAASSQAAVEFFENDRFAATPNFSGRMNEVSKKYAAYMNSQGHRVVLSGLAGESATGGGLPIPRTELQNFLARARFFTLARQIKAWATRMRKSPLPLLWDAVGGFLFGTSVAVSPNIYPSRWFAPGFVRRNHAALSCYPYRVKLFGPLPSFQDNICKLDAERRLLAFYALPSGLLRELRYPYVDRDLLEFMYAVPTEQIVRVGQRRSLMRRALVGIVPDEVLSRRRKAFAPQASTKDAVTEWRSLSKTDHHILSSSIGIVDANRFSQALQKGQREEVPINSLKKTLSLESWLHHLAIRGVLSTSKSTNKTNLFLSFRAKRGTSQRTPRIKEPQEPHSFQQFG
jgi:asparagine synthase (glutamine-hydrolysing)